MVASLSTGTRLLFSPCQCSCCSVYAVNVRLWRYLNVCFCCLNYLFTSLTCVLCWTFISSVSSFRHRMKVVTVRLATLCMPSTPRSNYCGDRCRVFWLCTSGPWCFAMVTWQSKLPPHFCAFLISYYVGAFWEFLLLSKWRHNVLMICSPFLPFGLKHTVTLIIIANLSLLEAQPCPPIMIPHHSAVSQD